MKTKFIKAIAIAAVAASATLPAWATSVTYRQAGNFEVLKLDGSLSSDTEITSTPQLAFPDISLDDIPERCSFFSTIYGTAINVQNVIVVGMHEKRHYDAQGHADKIALQFATWDERTNDNHMKGVVVALTNGEGGVYVQRVAQFHKKNVWNPHVAYYDMDASGNISQANSPNSWAAPGTTYLLKGFRLQGSSPTAAGKADVLVISGATVDDIKNCDFIAGLRYGYSSNVRATDNYATFITPWPNSTNPEKLVMQFEHPSDMKKTAVIQMTNGVYKGESAVYAYQSFHTWNGNAGIQRYSVDQSTGAVTASNTGGSSNATTSDPPQYPVHGLYMWPQCVKKTPNRTRVFSDPSKTLTLDDIKEGEFTSRFCGGYIQAYFHNTPNSAKGFNKKVYTDDSGSVTNIIVEIQAQDGSAAKCVVVSLENGEDGIYASALFARWKYETVGYEFYQVSKTNGTDMAVAEKENVDGYGVCDLRVTVPTMWTLDQDRTWSELRDGATLDSDAFVRIKVTDSDAVLTVDEKVNVSQIEFVDGTGATLNIAEGQTVTAESISGCVTNILNSGTVVKTGEGTATWPFNNDSTGVTIVSNGTLKVASVTGTGSSHTIRVASGATFDVNGKNYASDKYYGVTATVHLEEGANLANTQGHTGHNYNNFEIVRLVLDGDATVTATKDFGIVGINYSGARLELGSHTLTVTGGKEFLLHTTTVTGTGKVIVDSGTFTTMGTSGGDDWTLETGEDATLTIGGSSVAVGNFVNGGSVSGNATLTVNGTLTPGSAAINKLTLASGSTVKATGTAQVVNTTFAASGTVTIDASEITAETLRAGDVAVLTVPAAFDPSGVTWNVTGAAIAGTREKWRTDAGNDTKTLYIARPSGLTVIFW